MSNTGDETKTAAGAAPVDDDYGRPDDERGSRTRGMRTMQTVERRLSRGGRKLAQALADGMKKYQKQRNKSAKDRKDGAILDFVDNLGAGFAEAQRQAAPASEDIITAFSTKRTRKQFRRAVRALSSYFPFVR